MALALPNFAAVQAFFNNFIAANNIDITGAPHGAFWMNGYEAFVSGPVPNVVDPNTNLPIPILTKVLRPDIQHHLCPVRDAGHFVGSE